VCYHFAVQVHLYASYIGPASTLAIPADPIPAGMSVNATAAASMARVANPIPAQPEMKTFGVGVHLSESA
jgi:hypothetical protein